MKNGIKITILLGVLLYFTLIIAFMLDATNYARPLLENKRAGFSHEYFVDRATMLVFEERKLQAIEVAKKSRDQSIYSSFFQRGINRPYESIVIYNEEEAYPLDVITLDGEFYASWADLSKTLGMESNASHLLNINEFYNLYQKHLFFNKGFLNIVDGEDHTDVLHAHYKKYVDEVSQTALAKDNSAQAYLTIDSVDFIFVLNEESYIFTFDYLGDSFEAVYLKDEHLTVAYHKGKYIILNDDKAIVIHDTSIMTHDRSTLGYDKITNSFITFVERGL